MEKVPSGAGKLEIKRISLLKVTKWENSGIPRARAIVSFYVNNSVIREDMEREMTPADHFTTDLP